MPALFYSGVTFTASAETVFDRLTHFERGTTNVIPGLAESWDISEDGKEYTFHLRKGVKVHTYKKFHPKRDFNADDVIFSFERQLKESHPYHKYVGTAGYGYFVDMGMDKLIKSIEKIDDYTVKFVLNNVEAPFLANLAMSFASIVSAEYADYLLEKGTPEKFDLEPVGTGPFVFESYQKDAAIRFKAHPEYWGGKMPIDRLIFSITPDASVRLAKVKAGECHIMAYPNLADLEAIRKNPELNVLEKEGMNISYLSFNVEAKPLDDVRVRRALNIAVNKQAIVDSILNGAGVVAKNLIPPTIWSYNDEIEDFPYDPEAAKKLLAEAGYPNGFEIDLWGFTAQRAYNPDGRKTAEMIQADWEKIGVKARIVSYEWGEYIDRGHKGEHQAYLVGWNGDNGDPDNFFNNLFSCDAIKSGNNYSRLCVPEFDALLQQARKTTNHEERVKLYKQAQEIFKESAFTINISHTKTYEIARKEVIGYVSSPLGLQSFYGVDIKE